MIGIDVVSIVRIKRICEKNGFVFLDKFLGSCEIEMAKTPQTIAGFWAAKEAVSKAIGCGICSKLSFKDIEIKKTSKNKPYVVLSKKAQETHGIQRVEISITHDRDLAIAVAFLVRS